VVGWLVGYIFLLMLHLISVQIILCGNNMIALAWSRIESMDVSQVKKMQRIQVYCVCDCSAMSTTIEHMKECEGHIHDLEKENLDLHQKMNVDKKTLATLRQVCKNEQLSNVEHLLNTE